METLRNNGRPDNERQDSPGRISVALPAIKISSPLRGRNDILRTILTRVTAGSQPRVHILFGAGGTGKSTVALHLAHEAVANGLTVWWVSVAGLARLSAGMKEVAYELGASPAQLEQAWSGSRSATDLLWTLLSRHDHWLLVLDNADWPDYLAPEGGHVIDGTGWIRPPSASSGNVIVTTRDGSIDTWGSWVQYEEVRCLEAFDGAQVLMDVCGSGCGTAMDAEQLSGRLGGLPLALNAAGQYLASARTDLAWPGEKNVTSFTDYRAALDRLRIASRAEDQLRRPDSLGQTAVHDTCELSLHLLEDGNSIFARPLLRLLAAFADAPLPYVALLNIERLRQYRPFHNADSRSLKQSMRGLRNLGLCQFTDVTGAAVHDFEHLVSIHPVMRDVSFISPDYLVDEASYQRLVVDLVCDAAKRLDPDAPKDWIPWSILLPHCAEPIRSYLTSAHVQDVSRELYIFRMGARYLLATGHPREAQAFLEKYLSLPAVASTDTIEKLALKHEHARCLLERGYLQDAEKELRVVYEKRMGRLGERNADTLATRHKLARAIMEQGRWAEAEEEFRTIVLSERSVRGPEHSDTLTVRHSLGRAILLQGRPLEAREILEPTLEARERTSGGEHPEALGLRHTIARARLAMGEIDAAEAELRQVLEARGALWGYVTPEMCSVRHSLALALAAAGKREGALTESVQALEGRGELLGLLHHETQETAKLVEDLRAALNKTNVRIP